MLRTVHNMYRHITHYTLSATHYALSITHCVLNAAYYALCITLHYIAHYVF